MREFMILQTERFSETTDTFQWQQRQFSQELGLIYESDCYSYHVKIFFFYSRDDRK